jgi:enterochelin esterase family protein
LGGVGRPDHIRCASLSIQRGRRRRDRSQESINQRIQHEYLDRQLDEFGQDFVHDLKPFVEGRYRVHSDRANRAIAGLSMGGAQTLNIATSHLNDYGYIGVFSSGVFGIAVGLGSAPSNRWEERHRAVLDDPELKNGLRLVWFAIGKDDFLLPTSKATVDMLERHKFAVTHKETGGGHTWINWRQYLHDFAPLLFVGTDSKPQR